MALIFMDGFDASDYNLGKYSAFFPSATVLTAATRYGTGLALNHTASSDQIVRKDFPAVAKVIVGLAFKAGNFSDNANFLTFAGDSGSTIHVIMRIMASGAVALYRSNTQVAISPSPVCAVNTWHYIELSATISDTVGVATARVDGTQAVTFTGDTKNAGTNTTIDSLGITSLANGSNIIDDLYIADATGASPWNDFLGEVRVQTLAPSAAGSSTQLTPVGSANNWDNVEEMPFSVADYNYSTTPGARDLYAMTDVLGLTSSVLGVQLVTAAHKTDTAVRSVKQLVKPAGTVFASAAKVLATSPTIATTMHQVSPATSAAWTVAEVNAMETGVEVV